MSLTKVVMEAYTLADGYKERVRRSLFSLLDAHYRSTSSATASTTLATSLIRRYRS